MEIPGRNGFSNYAPEQQWKQIQDVRHLLDQPEYYIAEVEHQLTLTLLPVGKTVRQYHDPLKAINDFFITYSQSDTFGAEKSSALLTIKQSLRSGESYIEKTQGKIQSLQTDNNYKVWADLVMAHLHAIEAGSELVVLPNFYQENRPLEIRLKNIFR